MYLICDIDKTVSKIPLDRAEFARRGEWDSYYACDFSHDEPVTPIVRIVQAWIDAGGIVMFVTSRREAVRVQTAEWLRTHIDGLEPRNHQLVMRKDSDMTPESVWKIREIRANFPRQNAALVIDDDPFVCDILAAIGYKTLQAR